MKIIEVTKLDEITNYKNDFDRLDSKTDYFQTYDFIVNYLKFYKEKFSIDIIKKDNNIIILPLSLFKYKGLSFYGFIGSPDISEENEIITNIKDFSLFANLLNHYFYNSKKRYFFCNLKNGILKKYLSQNSLFYNLDKKKTNTVNISKSEIYKDSKTKYKDNAYEFRKFEKEYSLKESEFKFYDLNNSDILKLKIFDFILKNKSKDDYRYKKNLLFLLSLAKNNLIRVNLLKVKDYLLSVIIYSVHRKTLYYIIPSYNKTFKKFSFGKIHLIKLLNKNKNNNISQLFLGPGEEMYKKKFILEDDYIFFFSNSKLLRFLIKLKLLLKG